MGCTKERENVPSEKFVGSLFYLSFFYSFDILGASYFCENVQPGKKYVL